MIKILSTAFILLFYLVSLSQDNVPKNVYLKLSGGRVNFGSGDISGYSLAFDFSKDLVKKSGFGLHKFLVGGELIFENGVRSVVVDNPTLSEFFSSYHQVSNTLLWAKASYHPFKKIFAGFNIQLGPTIGYSQRSGEESALRSVDILGQATRWSRLYFDNGLTYGYRILTGMSLKLPGHF